MAPSCTNVQQRIYCLKKNIFCTNIFGKLAPLSNQFQCLPFSWKWFVILSIFRQKKQISIWPRTRRKLSNTFVFQMISCRHFWNFCFWDWRFHFSIGVSSKLSVGVEWYMTILREGLSYFSTLKRISWENVFILFFCSLYQNAQKRISITIRTYKQNTYIKCMYEIKAKNISVTAMINKISNVIWTEYRLKCN